MIKNHNENRHETHLLFMYTYMYCSKAMFNSPKVGTSPPAFLQSVRFINNSFKRLYKKHLSLQNALFILRLHLIHTIVLFE